MAAKRKTARRVASRSGTKSHSDQRKAFGYDIPPVARDVLFCLLMFAILVFVYRGYIVDGKVDIVADTVNQGAPFDRFAAEFQQSYDQTPLWYPHIFGGMPFQASGSYQSLQYTFETLIRAVLPDRLFSGLHGRYLFHMLLGAISMFLLGRALTLSRGASFVAAMGFVLNSHVVGTDHVNRLACFMHIPLVFLSTYKLFEKPHVIWAILLGGAFGSQLGSYHPQIAHYTGMMLGLYVVYTLIARMRESVAVKPLVTSSLFFGLGIAIAAAMAAVMVWPMQEYAQYSARALSVGGQSVNVPFATSWSLSPGEILSFVLPSFSGFGGQTYWGQMPFTDFPNYVGVVIASLAVLGLAVRRDRITIFLGVLAAFALLVSLGRHMPWVSYLMLNFVPFFGKFRAPVMILILFQFSVSLLAAFGVQALLEQARRNTTSTLTRVIAISGCALFAFTFLVTLSGSIFQEFMGSIYSAADLGHPSRQAIAANVYVQAQLNGMRFDIFMDDLWIVTLLVAGFCALVLLHMTHRIGAGVLVSGVGLLVVLDLVTVAGRLVDPQYLPGGVNSFYVQRENDPVIQALTADDGLYRVFPVDEPNTNQYGYFGISSIGGYHAAKLGVYEELMSEVGFSSFPVLNVLNTKYLITKQQLGRANLTPVVESDQGNLYRNESVLPRAVLVDSLVTMSDKSAIFQSMKSPSFDGGRFAIVEKAIEGALGPIDGARVVITEYAPHRITISVDSPGRGLLVLSEVYYPAGWSASVDGIDTEIYKTNYAFRSVAVPEGEHTVVFAFEPASFSIGYGLSRFASALILLVLLGAGVYRFWPLIAARVKQ